MAWWSMLIVPWDIDRNWDFVIALNIFKLLLVSPIFIGVFACKTHSSFPGSQYEVSRFKHGRIQITKKLGFDSFTDPSSSRKREHSHRSIHPGARVRLHGLQQWQIKDQCGTIVEAERHWIISRVHEVEVHPKMERESTEKEKDLESRSNVCVSFPMRSFWWFYEFLRLIGFTMLQVGDET